MAAKTRPCVSGGGKTYVVRCACVQRALYIKNAMQSCLTNDSRHAYPIFKQLTGEQFESHHDGKHAARRRLRAGGATMSGAVAESHQG